MYKNFIILFISIFFIFSCWKKVEIIENIDNIDNEAVELVDYWSYKKELNGLLDDIFLLQEESIATLNCDNYLNLSYYPKEIHQEYLDKCNDIIFPAKLSFYKKEIIVKAEDRFPLEDDYRFSYDNYIKSSSWSIKVPYSEYISNFSSNSIPWLNPLSEQEYNNINYSIMTYEEYIDSIKKVINSKREEFIKKQEQYKNWLDENIKK